MLVLRRIFNFLKRMLIIKDLSIEKHMKVMLYKSLFKLYFFKKKYSNKKRAILGGFDIKFFEYEQFLFLYKEIFIENEYFFIADNDRPLIVDCGSNIGLSVIYFKTLYPNSRIIAFEPGAETYSYFKDNILNNKIESVITHNVALSSQDGELDFYYDEEDIGSLTMSTKKERMGKNKRRVKSVPLSRYIDTEVDFLKMDIEGAELEVIEEICKSGKISYVKQMIIEYHHHISVKIDEFSKLLNLLEEFGFGYQIQSKLGRPLSGEYFQDILVYAYKKDNIQ